jgi:transcriptional regulator with XRE-family HTH domain
MDIKELILKLIRQKKKVRTADIVRATGFSRAYINRFFKELREEGKIELIGRANQAFYVLAKRNEVEKAKQKISSSRHLLRNKNLSEDAVLDEIKKNTGIFSNIPDNVSKILGYAFTEMLNNAIEHSRSRQIEVLMKRNSVVRFDVTDRGVGIFFNIMKKRKLKSELEAIQDLLKGKQTTAPKEHTGEGIFFTSKVADMLTIQGSRKKLIFNNILGDIFIKDNNKKIKGTKVTFIISLKSKTNLNEVFKKYTDAAFAFAKTEVNVWLYKLDTDFISRSQARRVMSGLDKFKSIILDFKNVNTVGQAFADEVFRVWHSHHPSVKITYKNANENIVFMLKRAFINGR